MRWWMRLKCGQCFEETEQPDERIVTGLKTGSYEEEGKPEKRRRKRSTLHGGGSNR
jgi:hypothetical protein